MEAALWVCLSFLCLQGSLLQFTHGADCTGTSQGKNCVSGQTTGGKMWLDDMPSDVPLDRQKRQLGRNSLLPGSFSAKGFPNTLINVQTERARRHLGQSGTKKNKYKSRVGSFSLLSNNNPSASLQVTRVRRQVQNERKKAKPKGRPGAYSLILRPAAPQTIPLRTEMQEERTEEKTGLFVPKNI
eukprot:XP_014013155.1 PREDICTED: uncharacterized protein LOC106578645 isoform X4 [Salmo salar]